MAGWWRTSVSAPVSTSMRADFVLVVPKSIPR
jgi:hypothetical protein